MVQSPRRIGTTNNSNSLKDEKLKAQQSNEYQNPKLEHIVSTVPTDLNDHQFIM
ncbi:MAG: hypothetical protein QN834_10940 [Nitrososphaeraceae archaeon]|nr:hypothetical protein [Nitrososphaeraceae archaeon]MDW0271910.1 hypothetical protein [Nitrososphaeraceae archaeon]